MTSTDGEDRFDAAAIIARFWRARWWIVACVIVVAGGFTATAFLMTPVYQSSTVLISADADRSKLGSSLGAALGSLGGLASLAGIEVGGDGVEEALAVLRSRQFSESFIRDNALLPVLFADRWDEKAGDWKAGEEQPTLAKAYKYFDRNIRSIQKDKKTGLIVLRIQWKDRELAAAWANELVRRLNEEMRRRAVLKADASLRYLEKEFETTQLVGTRQAIGRVIEAQIERRMLASVSDEYALRVVDPALPSDPDDPARPRKMLLIVIGPFVGAVVGALAVFLWGSLSTVLSVIRSESASGA